MVKLVRKMYEDDTYKYDTHYREYYTHKYLKLKPFDKIPKFLNPITFIRILENYVPLERSGFENNGCFTLEPALRSTKRVIKLVRDKFQKEWTYIHEERDLIHNYTKVTSQLQYLKEWLNSIGLEQAHKFSKLVDKYLENIISIANAHIELVEAEADDYSETENDSQSQSCPKHERNYIKKIPDNIWANIRTKCYFKRVTMYDIHKTCGYLIETVVNDNFVEKTKMKPSLHDGHDGFEVYSLLTMKNFCDFYMQTFSGTIKLGRELISKSSIKVVDVDGNEVFKNDWDFYKEMWIEGTKLYSTSIAVYQD